MGRHTDRHHRRHDGPRPPGRLVQGLAERPDVLHRARQHGGELRRTRTAAATSAARSGGPPAQTDPVYSDCGATVLANYQQTKISRAAEPQRADRLRRPPGRPRHPDRPPRRRPAARPRIEHDDGPRPDPGLHGQRGRDVRPGDRQRFREQPLGLPLLLAAHGRGRHAVDRRGRHPDHTDRERAEHRRVAGRVGPVGRLLPAVAVPVRRRHRDGTSAPRPGVRAADPARAGEPRRLLPRRRRHRLRRRRQPLAGHRRRHACRRR